MAPQASTNSVLRVSSKAARQDTRTINLRLVLQQLFGGQVLSRADLARTTGLTAATISTLVKQLETEGLVVESTQVVTESRVGKPPTLLQLAPSARCVVAVDLSDPIVVRAGLVDLAGNITESVEIELGQATGDVAVALVNRAVSQAIERADSPILGIGIGTPGVVGDNGIVVESTRFGWHGVDLQRIDAAADFPVSVINDANAVAIAEYSRGGHDRAHLGVIKIGFGVGAGFVLNGRPFQGQHFGAGEIGHLVVDPLGPECPCGHRGCLETLAAVPSIEAALANNGANREQVLAAAADSLGVALSAIVSILDVGVIVVSGPRSLLGDDFCDAAAASLRSRCLQTVGDSVEVRYTSLGDNGVLLGAAALVLSKELGVA